MSWPPRQFLLGVLAVVAFAQPLRAQEYDRFENLSIAAPDAQHPRRALLTLPAEWRPGDAAVIVLADRVSSFALRDHLVGGLLAHQVGVLEVNAGDGPENGPRSEGRGATAAPEDAVELLAAALRVLRRQVAPGMVMAIGHGRLGAEAVLRAADRAPAEYVAAGGFAGHAALGPERAVFVAGTAAAAAPAQRDTASRQLCDAFAWAHAAAPTPRRDEAARKPSPSETERACRASLLPPLLASPGRRE